MLRRFLILLFIVSCFGASNVFAEEVTLKEEVAQLKARLEMLENRVAQQDNYITTQAQTVETQSKQINEYETRLVQFEEKLKRVPGEPMKLMQGLELGVGGTMIVQGTNNVNYNGDGQTQKKDRTDGSYSADITLAKEFKEVDGRAFLHLEAGQGAGLEDNLTLYGNVNRDAGESDANVQVTELWYEQNLFKIGLLLLLVNLILLLILTKATLLMTKPRSS